MQKGTDMQRILLGTVATVAIASSAFAADMPRKAPPPVAAPPVAAPVYNWSGCYVAGGGGYGMWNQDTTHLENGVPLTSEVTSGGRGWFGTVGGGCDLQVGQRWVIGAFADYDFADIKGDLIDPVNLVGREKERSAWAAGGRIGFVVTPAVLAYVNGGYTQARFSAVNLFEPALTPIPTNLTVPAQTYSGWFIGTGYEYNLGWIPGLFWRTEYRYAQYDRDNVGVVTSTGAPTTSSIDTQKSVQTIRSELVWRFNWGGPVRAGY